MKLDVRFPIGLMFGLFGLLLVVYGLASNRAIYARSLGINVNLVELPANELAARLRDQIFELKAAGDPIRTSPAGGAARSPAPAGRRRRG